EGYEAVGQVNADIIPTTLLDSLMARLDRLGSAKPLAQIAAVLGREFDCRVLEESVPEPVLSRDLQRLVDSQLLYRSGDAPSTYAFKHALIQEAAYQSLLPRKRQEYHLLAANTLKERFSDLHQPELLAHHYACGGLPAEAVEHWQIAGQRAIES